MQNLFSVVENHNYNNKIQEIYEFFKSKDKGLDFEEGEIQ